MKKVFIVFMLLFFTGCTVKYDIEFTPNLKIKEAAEILELNSKYEENGTTGDAYIDIIYDSYKEDSDYVFKKVIGNQKSGMQVSKSGSSIDNYNKNNKLKESLFDSVKVTNKDGVVEFSATGFKYIQIYNDIEGSFPYEDIVITIKTPFEVIETNADIKDYDKGLFTWNINKDIKTPEIKIKFKNKLPLLQQIKYYVEQYLWWVIGAACILLVAFVLIYGKNKKVNKIK